MSTAVSGTPAAPLTLLYAGVGTAADGQHGDVVLGQPQSCAA
ncbi:MULTISPECIES: hypothetical protein [unclassified Streptomyces]